MLREQKEQRKELKRQEVENKKAARVADKEKRAQERLEAKLNKELQRRGKLEDRSRQKLVQR